MDVTTGHSGKLCGVLGTSAALAPMPAPPWRVGLGWWMGLACAPVRPRLPKVGHGRANCLRGFAHPCPCCPRPPMCACHGIVRTLLLAAREEPASMATLGSWVDGLVAAWFPALQPGGHTWGPTFRVCAPIRSTQPRVHRLRRSQFTTDLSVLIIKNKWGMLACMYACVWFHLNIFRCNN